MCILALRNRAITNLHPLLIEKPAPLCNAHAVDALSWVLVGSHFECCIF